MKYRENENKIPRQEEIEIPRQEEMKMKYRDDKKWNISVQRDTSGRYHAFKSLSDGFIFQLGELVKCPTRNQKVPGLISAKVILKIKMGGPWVETLLEPKILTDKNKIYILKPVRVLKQNLSQ